MGKIYSTNFHLRCQFSIHYKLRLPLMPLGVKGNLMMPAFLADQKGKTASYSCGCEYAVYMIMVLDSRAPLTYNLPPTTISDVTWNPQCYTLWRHKNKGLFLLKPYSDTFPCFKWAGSWSLLINSASNWAQHCSPVAFLLSSICWIQCRVCWSEKAMDCSFRAARPVGQTEVSCRHTSMPTSSDNF